ncbi:MAG TPA: ATP-binding protein [Rhodothermales bacterium]|nr:ATP-binding protein [Rhodothermales bacterium]
MSSEPVPDQRHHRIVVQSDFAALERVVEGVDAFARESGADEDLAYRVVLLTTEAVTNAIEHGNALDPSKSVSVDLHSDGDEIEVIVRDEGGGFNLKTLRDPLAEENLLNEGGRGIFLIRTMADAYSFGQDGREVRIVFNLPPHHR